MREHQGVVVRGLGMVRSIGRGREEFWDALLAARCGFVPVSSFDTSRFSVHTGGEIKHFNPRNYVFNLEPDSIGRSSQLAIAAARLALGDGALKLSNINCDRFGVCLGTTSGEPHFIERFNDRYLQGTISSIGAEFLRRYPCHVVAGNVAGELGLAGEAMMIPTACAAGKYCISHASHVLRAGDRKSVG